MKKLKLYILLLCLISIAITVPAEAYTFAGMPELSSGMVSTAEAVSVEAVSDEKSDQIYSDDSSTDEIVSEGGETGSEFRYQTEEGLQIVSYVDTWQEDRLPEIENELNRNSHGMEMEYMARIEIHPGLEPGGNEQVSASYEQEAQQLTVPVRLAGFLPADYEIRIPVKKGVIRIFKGEEKQEAADIAMDLSHEYGHHFTFFHFDDAFSPENYKKSTYYQVRQLEKFPRVNGEVSYDEEIHRWSIFEIAAEDYHQLLGSPTGKRVTRFLDISQKMGSTTYQPMNTASRLDFNAVPQENWNIPLASQVDGLHQYLASFLDSTASTAALAPAADRKVMEKKTEVLDSGNVDTEKVKESVDKLLSDRSLPILSYRKEEHYGFDKYIIEWDALSTDETEQPVYTLVAINGEEQVIPIKTVYTDEDTVAVVGTITQVIEPYIYYYQDGLDNGSLDFRLYIQYPDGRVVSSEDLTIDFAE